MISHLTDLTQSGKELFGTKAAHLGAVKQLGIPVPEGFALSVETYDLFWAYNGFSYKKEAYVSKNQEIAQSILRGGLPDTIKTRIKQELLSLGDHKTYVVRSSAKCEDSAHYSMAGMFQSFIGLNTYEEVEEAIKKCYASLFSDRVMDFVLKSHMDRELLKMAVVVQEFIVGENSGVLFTADSVQMDPSTLSIHRVEGICENFVNGLLPTTIYNLDKASGHLKNVLPEGGGGLSITDLETLHRYAMKIEGLFGTYQDIEWTIKDGKVYILQARPITTFKNKEAFQPSWVNPSDAEKTWRCIDGEAYSPFMQDIMKKRTACMSKGAYDTAYGLWFRGELMFQNGYMYFKELPYENYDAKHAAMLKRLDGIYESNQTIFEDYFMADLNPLLKQLDAYTHRPLDRTQVIDFLRLAIAYVEYTEENHWYIAQEHRYMDETFRKYCEELCGRLSVEDFYDLVYAESIENKDRIWMLMLGDRIKKTPKLREMFESCLYDALLYGRFQETEEATELLSEIISYNETFGLLCKESFTFLNPLQGEMPELVLGKIRKFYDLSLEDMRKSMEKTYENKKRVLTRILSQLDDTQKEVFLAKHALAEKVFTTADNHNFYVEGINKSFLRLALMEAGRILCAEGLVEAPEELQYLFLEEVYEVLETPRDIKVLIKERKSLYQWQTSLVPPERLGKVMPPPPAPAGNQEPVTSEPGTFTIQGVSGLSKKVRGKAVHGTPTHLPEDAILILPNGHVGDIYHLLSKVKGFIFQWGSPFDHFGILSREMDVPAMYHVADAMARIKNGDTVEIDGHTGTVTVIPQV